MPRQSRTPNSACPPEPLATPDEVSAYLKDVPVKTLAKWRVIGKGPVYTKVGRHVRYDWADVRAWLKTQRADAGE